MAIRHQTEPLVSDTEVERWIEEAQRLDRRRRQTVDSWLFRAVCVLFFLILTGYTLMSLFSVI